MKKILLFFTLLVLAAPLFSQNYIEVPVVNESGGPYVTTYMEHNGAQVRSFTYRYDTDKHIALWVAYPLNTDLIGHGSRGDGWVPDPSIKASLQATLFKGFAYGSGYDRGHQIPSADRLSPEANQQTFRFTNATPQLHDFNGGIWAELEKVVRTWAKRSDTLYVVTGCIPSSEYINDNDGKPVNIPSVYYKTVLRRYRDKVGNLHWDACSVVLPHKVVDVKTWQQNLSFFKEHSLSLSELEKITGENYFPSLRSLLGKMELAALKSKNPSRVDWWWK